MLAIARRDSEIPPAISHSRERRISIAIGNLHHSPNQECETLSIRLKMGSDRTDAFLKRCQTYKVRY